ncbi:MAG TPA: LysR family transcriptional regulator substrate-binding protein [Terrimicrobiaceae bacterium]
MASLTIIGGEGVLAWLVYPRLAQMLDAFDKVSFSFRQSSTMDSVQSVRTGKADIALIRSNALTQDLLPVPLGIMKYRVVVPRRLLPGKFAASFDSLRSLPTAVLRGSGNFVRSLHEVARSAGFELIVAAEADSFVALRALVESEAVAAVLPEGLVDTFSLERFARISAKELDSRRKIVVTCNARSASLRPAIHQATQQLASLWAP